MTALLLAAITFVSTALGGLFALRQRRHLYLVMGAAAGLLVGAALLDLLPDALSLVAHRGRPGVMVVVLSAAGGFIAFFAVDHAVHRTAAGHTEAGVRGFGAAAALGLTVHSFLDGLAIGAAFEQSSALGGRLASRGDIRASLVWLLADAAAPFAGVLVARTLQLPQTVLADLLG